MIRSITLALFATAAFASFASAHCQVPCGIYGDDRRFDELLEDTQTIAKSIAQIGELSGTHDATGHNQLARWVATKEAHASNIQKIIADYFMAQRIKGDDPQYVGKLTAAHRVMVAAMKAKQAADPATATALEKAIKGFQHAYAGEHSHDEHGHDHAH